MLDPWTLTAIAATFLLAGTVKGVIGLGLPTVSLGVLTAVLDLPTAMALMIAPSFVTNLWQALAGGHTRAVLRRTWPFLLSATLTVWIGALALTRWRPELLSALLGLLLCLYAAASLGGLRLSLPEGRGRWAGPLFGITNGILTGMTGAFSVPGVLFLQALGLARDALVQAMGMLFTLSTLALALALHRLELFTPQLGTVSAAALLPALLGMLLGQRIRHGLSESRFRTVFFVGLLLLGAYISARAWFRLH